MGWDYYTYETQPVFFIEEILIFMNRENSKNKTFETTDTRITKSKGLNRNG